MVVQRKLAVGAADDAYEREADRVAAEVVNRLMATPTLEQKPLVARRADPAAVVGAEGGAVDSDTEARIQSARSSGRPLDESTRGSMETAMGADFGSVRIHEGSESNSLNRQLGAQAFTVGSDVFFRDGMPSGTDGARLLAHELTHTVQQGGAVQRDLADDGKQDAEAEAAISIAGSLTQSVCGQLGMAAQTLSGMIGLCAASMADPTLVGALMAQAATVRGLISNAAGIFSQVNSQWQKAKGSLSAGNKAQLVPLLDKAYADLGIKLNIWQGMAAAIAPGGMGLASTLLNELTMVSGQVGSYAGSLLGAGSAGVTPGASPAPSGPAEDAKDNTGAGDAGADASATGFYSYQSNTNTDVPGGNQYSQELTLGDDQKYLQPSGGEDEFYTSPVENDDGYGAYKEMPEEGASEDHKYLRPVEDGGYIDDGGMDALQPVVPPGGGYSIPLSNGSGYNSGYSTPLTSDQLADLDDEEAFEEEIEEDEELPEIQKHSHIRSVDPRYSAESISGSPDLPGIISMGLDLVSKGRFKDMTEFMKSQFGWSAEDVEKYITQAQPSKVAYLDEEERKAYELHGGSSLKQGEAAEAFDTGDMFSKHSGKGFGIYVMSPDGTLYADQHKVGLFHHSSFLAGGDVAGAGEIKVIGGAVKVVTNKTGHYAAGDPELWQVLDELKSRGVNLAGIEVRNDFRSKNPWPGGDALKFWETKKP